jgi:hypothetical protein
VKGIDAKNLVKRFGCQRQPFSKPLRERGSPRLGLRLSQHLSRGVQTHHASPTIAEKPKPVARAAANLEYTLVEMFADEGNKRRLDTRVVVLLVSAVVRCGDLVVVNASSHRVTGFRRTRVVGWTSQVVPRPLFEFSALLFQSNWPSTKVPIPSMMATSATLKMPVRSGPMPKFKKSTTLP